MSDDPAARASYSINAVSTNGAGSNAYLAEVCRLVGKSVAYDGVVTADTLFRDDLNLDSLQMVELVSEFEEHFGAELPIERLPALQTVGDVARMLSDDHDLERS